MSTQGGSHARFASAEASRARGSLAAAVAGVALLAPAWRRAPAAAKDIKVCLIAGKTGALEAYAKQTENGFMMGLEFLTKGTMKVGDDKLEVIVKDDQLKPDRGKSLLEECYGDDKADIAVGTTGSPVALAMLPVAEEHKKVLIVEPAVADSITGDKWNRYIFRTGPQLLSGCAGRRRRLSRKTARCRSACWASTRPSAATASPPSSRRSPACGPTSRSSPRNTPPATRPTSRRSPSACSTR